VLGVASFALPITPPTFDLIASVLSETDSFARDLTSVL
jgi:hypothetical protein